MLTQRLRAALVVAMLASSASASTLDTTAKTEAPPAAIAGAEVQADKVPLSDPRIERFMQAYMTIAMDIQSLAETAVTKCEAAGDEDLVLSTEGHRILKEVFGKEQPLHLVRSRQADGKPVLDFGLDSLAYQDADSGFKVSSDPLQGKAVFAKGCKSVKAEAKLPTLQFDADQGLTLGVVDVRFDYDMKLDLLGFWLGKQKAWISRLSLEERSKEVTLVMDGIEMHANTRRRGKFVNMDIVMRVKTVDWGKDQLGPINLALKVTNMDAAALGALTKAAKKLNLAGDKAASKAAFDAISKQSLQVVLASGIEISDFSLGYHGGTAKLVGGLKFNGLKTPDLDNPEMISKKLNAKMEVRVPISLAKEVARSLAVQVGGRSVAGEPAPSPAELADAGENKVLALIETLRGNKWVRVVKDVASSTLEFKTGRLFVNGNFIPVGDGLLKKPSQTH